MSTAIQLPHSGPSRPGQATMIEQSRAIAEVQGAILVAQQCPRSVERALETLERSCQEPELANRAFYRYRRGGEQITGPTIHLAQELARCWQNMQSGLIELSRDTVARQSEMMAFAWDLEMNTRRTTTFISPHQMYTGGDKQLDAMRDIYENNTSAGARREREMILAVLPSWFVKKGEALCRATIAKDANGKPIEERRRDAVTRFESIGVRRAQLVDKLGVPVDGWLDADLATLSVIYQSIRSGEVAKEAEFPAVVAQVTAADIIAPADPPQVGKATTGHSEAVSQAKLKPIHAWFTNHQITDRDTRLSYIAALVERDVTSSKDLTTVEAEYLLARLRGFDSADDPITALQEAAAEWYERPADDDQPTLDGES